MTDDPFAPDPLVPPAPTDWSRWADIDALFEHALDCPPGERTAFVANAPADASVRASVLALIAASEDSSPLSAAIWRGPDDLREALDPLDGSATVGPWRILRPIGRGGMGTVYLAERTDGEVRQQVALKVLRRGLDTDDVLRRFRVERRALAALSHPHVARLIDGGSTIDGRPWLAMEYVEGVDAATWCRTAAPAVRERVALVRQIARAVEDAHRNLIVHRDIKPANVLVTKDGVPKLLDFGIAKMLDDGVDQARTRTGARLLTPRYAAPEQQQGAPVTTATDVYQLGTLLVELATGVPFEQANARTGGGDAALRGDLARIAAKALQEEPTRRYGTAGALADDLDRWLDGRPVSARPDTIMYRSAKFLQRHRWLGPSVALTLLLGGGWITSVIRQTAAIASERDAAQQQAARAEQVLAFVVDLFRSADPNAGQSHTGLPASMTVVDAMQLGADRVRRELDELPAVQAELLGTITDVLLTLESPEPIDSLARDALDRTERAWGDSSAAYARALVRLGRALAATGDVQGADSAYRAAIAHRRQHAGRLDTEAARAMSHLGSLKGDAGLLREAVTLLQGADSLFSTVGSPRDAADHLRTMAALGNVWSALDSLPAAADAYRRARTVAVRWVGPRHPQVGVAEVNLGGALSKQGHHAEAAQHFAAGLAVLRETLGPASTTTTAATNNLANALAAAGRLDDAATTHRQLIAQRRTMTGASAAADLAASVQNLAVVEAKRGDTTTALRLHREAAALYRDAGVQGAVSVFPLLSLGGLLLAQGSLTEAEAALAAAQVTLNRFLPASHVAVAVVECRLARSRVNRTPVARTIVTLRRAVARLQDASAVTFRHECEAALADALQRR